MNKNLQMIQYYIQLNIDPQQAIYFFFITLVPLNLFFF